MISPLQPSLDTTNSANKVLSLTDAVAGIPDGAVIGLGGLSMNSAPMAVVREIIRQGKKDLTMVALVAGLPIDWLAAAGSISRVVTGLVSLEGFGLAQHFRRGVEGRKIIIEEYSEHLLICRLQAQAHGLPFVPTRAGLGTDVLRLHKDTGTVREEVDPATGEHYVACTRLPIDIALVHCHEADQAGNARVNPKLIWMDNELVNAAPHTIISTEAIVETDAFRAEPWRTTYPRFMTNTVVHAPFGALPTSMFPSYSHNSTFYERYVAASGDSKSFQTFFERYVVAPASWEEFLELNDLAKAGTAMGSGHKNK